METSSHFSQADKEISKFKSFYIAQIKQCLHTQKQIINTHDKIISPL